MQTALTAPRSRVFPFIGICYGLGCPQAEGEDREGQTIVVYVSSRHRDFTGSGVGLVGRHIAACVLQDGTWGN